MTGPCLLVVDDDPHITTLLRIALGRNGYEIRESHSGREALNMARRRPPDAVLLDLHMPDMSGVDLLRCMGTEPRLRRVPVIVATGEADPPELPTAFATLTKPFKLRILCSTIRDAIEQRAEVG